jgi:carboxylesterase type B
MAPRPGEKNGSCRQKNRTPGRACAAACIMGMFARSGDPNHSRLPHWPAYAPGEAATMVFDNACSVQEEPGMEARRVLRGE